MKLRHDKKTLEDITQHPATHYKSARDVLLDVRLTADQKIVVLDNWADEQNQILAAGNENMQAEKRPQADAEAAKLLQDIKTARESLS